MPDDVIVPPTPPAKPWFEGIADAETIGHWQNRGWHEKTAQEVAIEATKAHREAERLIGAPANQMLKLPSSLNDDVAMAPVWQRLGAPKDAKDYDFSSVKYKDGTPLKEDFVNFLRETSAKNFLTKDAATRVAQSLVAREENANTSQAADMTEALTKEHTALNANWGQNAAAYKVVARLGAEKLGFGPNEVDALEKVVGYAKIMEGLRKVGSLAGEDKFLGGPGGNGNPTMMTREQAVARKSELMSDTAWAGRYLAGGSPEVREMTALQTIITGTD